MVLAAMGHRQLLVPRGSPAKRALAQRQALPPSAAGRQVPGWPDVQGSAGPAGDTGEEVGPAARDPPRLAQRAPPGLAGGVAQGQPGPAPPGAPPPPPSVSGQLCLMGVALLWGTYSPCLKLLYSSPGPPSPVALTAARSLLQAAVLAAVVALSAGNGRPAPGSSAPGSANGPAVPAKRGRRWAGSGLRAAALELGLWNFLATSLQAFGLELTSATRGAFLIQATALLTPVLAALGGQRAGRQVWAACALALLGTLAITADRTGAVTSLQPVSWLLGGDAAILGAALFYSMATVRLGRFAKAYPAVSLAAGKSAALALFAVGALASTAAGLLAAGQPLASLWPGLGHPAVWAALAWSALGPGALAAFLQTRGQSSVAPAQAQVIFSTMPLWSALFAGLLLPGEGLGPAGWAGGATVVLAGLLAAWRPQALPPPRTGDGS